MTSKDEFGDRMKKYESVYKAIRIPLEERYENAPTLLKFLRGRTSYEICMPLMIQVEDKKDFCHMVTAHYSHAADNHTMKPVPIDKFPHLRKYVTNAFVVMKN